MHLRDYRGFAVAKGFQKSELLPSAENLKKRVDCDFHSQRIRDLGCTDMTVIPSLLGICPWLFRCSATRQLAAVICGSTERMQVVDAAVRHMVILRIDDNGARRKNRSSKQTLHAFLSSAGVVVQQLTEDKELELLKMANRVTIRPIA